MPPPRCAVRVDIALAESSDPQKRRHITRAVVADKEVDDDIMLRASAALAPVPPQCPYRAREVALVVRLGSILLQ
eukprot:scaffold3884_cov95-Skeletonema_dohrnii-CCMP3373.AAC.1